MDGYGIKEDNDMATTQTLQLPIVGKWKPVLNRPRIRFQSAKGYVQQKNRWTNGYYRFEYIADDLTMSDLVAIKAWRDEVGADWFTPTDDLLTYIRYSIPTGDIWCRVIDDEFPEGPRLNGYHNLHGTKLTIEAVTSDVTSLDDLFKYSYVSAASMSAPSSSVSTATMLIFGISATESLNVNTNVVDPRNNLRVSVSDSVGVDDALSDIVESIVLMISSPAESVGIMSVANMFMPSLNVEVSENISTTEVIDYTIDNIRNLEVSENVGVSTVVNMLEPMLGISVYDSILTSESVKMYSDAYDKLLLHLNGTDGSTTFTDNSPYLRSATVYGGAQIDTAYSKFGGAAGLFYGSGDYITFPNSDDWDFGSGVFTIDFWIRRDGTQAYSGIICVGNTGTSVNRWGIHFDSGGTKIQVTTINSGSVYGYVATSALSDLTWTHVAIVRSASNVLKIYLNGVAAGTFDPTSRTFDDNDNTALLIGRMYANNDSSYFKGHLDEVRICKGIARWTGDFSVPTSEYY